MSWLKYFMISLLFLAFLVFIAFISMTHQSNIASTQSVGLEENMMRVGLARENLEGRLDMNMLIEELTSEIASSFKGHKGEVEIFYELYDEHNQPTFDNEKVKSIQFETNLLSENGEVQSISRERIEVHNK